MMMLTGHPGMVRCAGNRPLFSTAAEQIKSAPNGRPCRVRSVRSISGRRSYVKRCRASEAEKTEIAENADVTEEGASVPEILPEGELMFEEPTLWQKSCANFKMFFAPPWQRCKGNSILALEISGQIQDLLPDTFSRAVSLPGLCEALTKAAYDPRIKGLYLNIDVLDCGWAKLTEVRRHVEFFKQSGKFSIAYMTRGAEKEYYLASACDEIYTPPSGNVFLRGLRVSGTFLRGAFDKAGVEPQVRRIGKYKSAGDQLLREDMSEPQKEQLSALLEDLYDGFIAAVSESRSIPEEKVVELLDTPYYGMETMKEGGFVTDLKYKDEILDMLKERLGVEKKKKVSHIPFAKYKRVPPGTFGLNKGKLIAVIRASGAITTEAPGGSPLGGGSDSIAAKTVIREIRKAADIEKVEAIVLRIDSPGGDALASDLMWREIKKVAGDKPVIASMGDVAASGGYYMAMAADKIVAEPLTITGSIGVVLGKINLGELYKKIGVGKETIAKGRFADLFADNRGFTEDEDSYFSGLAEHSYAEFRNKAAKSRGMEIETMQELAQGRVWSGKRALENGLVDALGGFPRAVAIAKEAAGLKPEDKVRLMEFSKKKGSPFDVLQGAGAMSGSVSSVILLGYGLLSLLASGKGGEIRLLEGAGCVLFGGLGLVDVLKGPDADPEWEYTMSETDMEGSEAISPQAVMDDSILTSQLLSPAIKDLINKIK
ncbi:hypothetical protein BSKO_05153 [Bryopsis sp. KO-2023]|nr:hypothetical protein BSKO_05153 [Bryopsis sp. KO-2023]